MPYEKCQQMRQPLAERAGRDHLKPKATGRQSDSTLVSRKADRRNRETFVSTRAWWHEHVYDTTTESVLACEKCQIKQNLSLDGRAARLINRVRSEGFDALMTPQPCTVHKLPGQMSRPEIDDPSTCAPLSSSRTLPRPVYSSTYVLFAEWWSAAESAIATDSRSCARITSNQVSTLVLSIFGPRRLVDNFAFTGLFHSGAIRCSHWSVRET